MEIRQIVRDIKRNWFAFAGVFLLCVAIGGAAAFLPAKHYTASTTLVVQPTPGVTDPASALAEISVVVPQLPIEAGDATTFAAARDRVPSQYANASVSTSATADIGTDTVAVSATSSDPQVAAAYANAMAKALESIQPPKSLYTLSQLSPAVPPSSPSNPRLPLLVAAVAFGLIAGVFASMAAAGIRRRMSRVAEVRERIGATVMGEIPRQRGAPRPTELFVANTRHPAAAEAFLELRSNLVLSDHAKGSVAIAVTSCDAGEGKTTVAANLAWALARADHPVVALDADLRKPMLHHALGVPFGPGVAGGTPGRGHGVAQASPTGNPELDVVPAGIPERHPADVLSAYLPPMLEELKHQGRTTVVDCPPVVGAAETVLIAAMVDVVLVVVDTRRFNPDRLQQCLVRLDGAGARVVAVVLNRLRRRELGHGSAYAYGYYGPAAPGTAAPPSRRPWRRRQRSKRAAAAVRRVAPEPAHADTPNVRPVPSEPDTPAAEQATPRPVRMRRPTRARAEDVGISSSPPPSTDDRYWRRSQ